MGFLRMLMGFLPRASVVEVCGCRGGRGDGIIGREGRGARATMTFEFCPCLTLL